MSAWFFSLGAVLAGLSVVVGAFGAHGLRERVSPDLLVVFETGARYHFYHALALLALGLAALREDRFHLPRLTLAGSLFILGILLFSGSLYVLVLTGTRWLGAVTPLGGLAFMAGWVVAALSVRRA